MRLKFLLFILLVVACTGLSGQMVSKAKFEKAVDYVNCKAVKLSLSQFPEEAKRFGQECDCNAASFQEINQAIPQNRTETVKLSAEINKVKSEYKQEQPLEQSIKILTENIFKDSASHPRIFGFAKRKRSGNDTFSSFKKDLEEKLGALFKTGEIPAVIDTNEEATDTQDLEKQVIELRDTINRLKEDILILQESIPVEKNRLDGFAFYVAGFAVFLTVILSVLVFRFRQKDPISKSYVKEKINKAFADRSINQSSSDITDNIARQDIQDLKKDIRDLSFKLENFVNPPPVRLDKFDMEWEINTPAESNTISEIFFLSTPNTDGSFNASSASSTFREGASIYRFSKISNNRAKFRIEEREASIRLALQYPDVTIDPVCDALNAFNRKARKIITETEGEAELVNDKWIVNRSQKAKIRYES